MWSAATHIGMQQCITCSNCTQAAGPTVRLFPSHSCEPHDESATVHDVFPLRHASFLLHPRRQVLPGLARGFAARCAFCRSAADAFRFASSTALVCSFIWLLRNAASFCCSCDAMATVVCCRLPAAACQLVVYIQLLRAAAAGAAAPGWAAGPAAGGGGHARLTGTADHSALSVDADEPDAVCSQASCWRVPPRTVPPPSESAPARRAAVPLQRGRCGAEMADVAITVQGSSLHDPPRHQAGPS